MATLTAGTLATTTLTALQSAGLGTQNPSDADIAAITVAILNDQSFGQIVPGAWSRAGLLFIPNRGVLRMQPDDWAAVDPAGFPYLIPASALGQTTTATGTATSGSKNITFASSVLALGWKISAQVTGTNIPASSFITNISSDGKTITISNAATGSGANTATYGTFTHS